jgi:peptide/nickel transport system substrate-binding protein
MVLRMPSLSRRAFGAFGAAASSALLLPRTLRAQEEPVRGGTLRFLVDPEPTSLVPLSDTTGANVMLSCKITEGLYGYDLDFSLRPQLAVSHTVAPDGKELTFKLREGVKWHDGQPFTSADVAFSLMTLKISHPRGRATYANLEEVQTPDAHTVVLKMKAPAPYLLNALAGQESPIVPKHIYDGSDVTTTPHNHAPIGTGPFKFKEWQRGSHMIFERNEEYWDAGKPYLDRIIVRFIPDAAARSIAFETGEVDVGGDYPIPYSDLERLSQVPTLGIETKGYGYGPNISAIEFNLDNPYFAKPEVRQAVAHAVNKEILLQNVYYGFGEVATGPIHQAHSQFYTADVLQYGFDPERANQLLDQAGLPRNDEGIRFAVSHDPLPIGNQHIQSGEYIRQALAQVGIQVTLRNQDMATYIKRVYADRDFDFVNNTMTNSPDPTLGVQRFYWSKNFKPGVPFSNGSHYANPEVDRLLEAAQVEQDPARRVQLFHDFQKIVAVDIPTLNTIAIQTFTIHSVNLKNHTLTADGIHANLAEAYLVS